MVIKQRDDVKNKNFD